mmetsp:Transcript_19744/g.61285  ORF Transcript_19744/g.61285 Transcript_19744/m.61285 type:complete len:252 (+) Transcript_19744:303-1058(+)
MTCWWSSASTGTARRSCARTCCTCWRSSAWRSATSSTLICTALCRSWWVRWLRRSAAVISAPCPPCCTRSRPSDAASANTSTWFCPRWFGSSVRVPPAPARRRQSASMRCVRWRGCFRTCPLAPSPVPRRTRLSAPSRRAPTRCVALRPRRSVRSRRRWGRISASSRRYCVACWSAPRCTTRTSRRRSPPQRRGATRAPSCRPRTWGRWWPAATRPSLAWTAAAARTVPPRRRPRRAATARGSSWRCRRPT